jgi:subtilisin family serine protease
MSVSRGRKAKGGRELIVVMKPPLSAAPGAAPAAPDTSHLAPLLAPHEATIEPILRRPESSRLSLGLGAHSSSGTTGHLYLYHHVAARDEHLDELRGKLAADPMVETAYIKPPGQSPALQAGLRLAAAAAQPSPTPDFTPRQGYLAPAPVGIDAKYAWTVRGGRGAGVRIIDCEWSWNFTHEDLASHCGGAAVGTPDAAEDDNHGTSVIGAIIGNDNGFGVTGVAPDATLSTACFGSDWSDKPTSAIIMQAADLLSAGDILLLEIHRPGPRWDQDPNSEFGFIPIEWWPDDFQAIAYATSKGIIVVEPAGNGFQNLDDALYATPLSDFPANWKNPFAPGGPDSGAIVVGAGNPPAGVHNRTVDTLGFNETYVDRARCSFSNYGSRVDCQGWGFEVTTLGGGDLQPGGQNATAPPTDRNRLYTDVFAGTSSASPIVVGAAACVQGALLAASRPALTPSAMRQLLRTTGSPQQSAPDRQADERIGTRPDLRAILQRVVQEAPVAAPMTAAPSALAPPAPVAASLTSRKNAAFANLGFLALVAAIVVTLGLVWSGATPGALSATPFTAWLCDLALVTLFFAAIGLAYEQSWIGVAVDWRQRLSLSRLQMAMWTILIVSTLLATLIWNVAHPGTTSLEIPGTFWLLMGIAGVSAVGDPLILNNKPDAPPAGAPLTPPGMINYGVVVARPPGASVSWRDLIMGDELGNASVIDIGKVQQLLLTLVAFVSYAVAIGHMLFDATGAIAKFPEMSNGFLSLLAASHAVYLSYKAAPHT